MRLWPGWICLWWAAGCGYHFSIGNGRLPDGSRQLQVPVVENWSTEAAAGAWLTDSLRHEAVRAGLDLSDVRASSCLKGRVVSISTSPCAVAVYGGEFHAPMQEAIVRAEFFWEQGSNNHWQVSLEAREKYLSAPDLRNIEANRQLAVKAALGRVAREAIERLSIGF